MAYTDSGSSGMATAKEPSIMERAGEVLGAALKLNEQMAEFLGDRGKADPENKPQPVLDPLSSIGERLGAAIRYLNDASAKFNQITNRIM